MMKPSVKLQCAIDTLVQNTMFEVDGVDRQGACEALLLVASDVLDDLEDAEALEELLEMLVSIAEDVESQIEDMKEEIEDKEDDEDESTVSFPATIKFRKAPSPRGCCKWL